MKKNAGELFRAWSPEDCCEWCNGYGSSLKDPEGVNTCTRCGGTGIKRNRSNGTAKAGG